MISFCAYFSNDTDPKCFFLFIDYVQVSWSSFMLRTFVWNLLLGYLLVMVVLSWATTVLHQIGLQWDRGPMIRDSSEVQASHRVCVVLSALWHQWPNLHYGAHGTINTACLSVLSPSIPLISPWHSHVDWRFCQVPFQVPAYSGIPGWSLNLMEGKFMEKELQERKEKQFLLRPA